jgi:hypothetical protein
MYYLGLLASEKYTYFFTYYCQFNGEKYNSIDALQLSSYFARRAAQSPRLPLARNYWFSMPFLAHSAQVAVLVLLSRFQVKDEPETRAK